MQLLWFDLSGFEMKQRPVWFLPFERTELHKAVPFQVWWQVQLNYGGRVVALGYGPDGTSGKKVGILVVVHLGLDPFYKAKDDV